MTRFTGSLMQAVLVPVCLLVLALSFAVGLSGINNHDWIFIALSLAGVVVFAGLVRLMLLLEASKK
jgi:ABC-type dipeptide/oligopeptide/nickel transport system permease subunit